MIKNTTTLAMTLLLSGCHIAPWSHRNAKPTGPPLPMNVSCDELVDHLNQQSGDLKAWQCTDVKVAASFPGIPYVRMKGNIACEYPNCFHLTATNPIASADMGANSEQCWFQSTPGHHGVISWRHEDSHLLQGFASQVPYIDPDWLMLVLGVKQLDSNDYVLEPASDPRNNELRLSSVRRATGHAAHRYVIKVDRQSRVVREHIAFDRNGAAIVRAELSSHRDYDGHLLPQKVRLELPGNDRTLTLSFSRIDTNPSLDTALWIVPSVPGGDNVDLGSLISGVRQAGGQRPQSERPAERTDSMGAPQFQQFGREPPPAAIEPEWAVDRGPTEPRWATSLDSASPFGHKGTEVPQQRRLLGLFPVPRLFRR